MSNPDLVSARVLSELKRAMNKFPPLHSGHEAYAVILEELEEYWDLVKTKGSNESEMTGELIQVAAMAIRAIIDLYQED